MIFSFLAGIQLCALWRTGFSCLSQVLKLGGIPALVSLLRSPHPGVSQASAGALRNLVFKHHHNKLEVQHCGGIAKALQLLKETNSTETQKQITGMTFSCGQPLRSLGCIHGTIPNHQVFLILAKPRPAVEHVIFRWPQSGTYSDSTSRPDRERGGAIYLLVRQYQQQQHTPWCLPQCHRLPAVRAATVPVALHLDFKSGTNKNMACRTNIFNWIYNSMMGKVFVCKMCWNKLISAGSKTKVLTY